MKKTQDYGTAWRILRPSSLTDQIFIKAKRIRSYEEKGIQKIEEGIWGEYIAIVNYCIMALIQIHLPEGEDLEMDPTQAAQLYDEYFEATKNLMLAKNHDYGEAWRDMRVSSLTDLILMKLMRIKQIEDNQGATLISEGNKGGYQDILNYAAFAMIRLQEDQSPTT
ncbi:MAG: DUF1599 domain-containing protein [Bacteroidota bacterium]